LAVSGPLWRFQILLRVLFCFTLEPNKNKKPEIKKNPVKNNIIIIFHCQKVISDKNTTFWEEKMSNMRFSSASVSVGAEAKK